MYVGKNAGNVYIFLTQGDAKMLFLIRTIKTLYARAVRNEVTSMGARLSYHLLLAFFPFLVFLITLIGYTPLTDARVLKDLRLILPEDTYRLVIGIIKEITAKKSGSLLSAGMFSALWIASGGLTAVISGINKAYDCKETRPFWKVRAIALIYTAGIAVSILLTFITLVFGEPLGRCLFDMLGYTLIFVHIWNLARYVIPIIILMFVLGALYYVLPNKRLRLVEIIPGTVFSTVLWIGISIAFSFYANNYNNYSSLYGSIGGVIILLVWLYWSSIIILLGGELNAVLSRNRSG